MFVVTWGALAWLFYRLRSQRDTDAGRAAAARWMGLRSYLAENPAFPGMPPAAEQLWDRYLAYAAAFGLARTAVRALPLRAEDPKAAWSAYTGTWRLVKLRWPSNFFPAGWGAAPSAAARGGAVWLLIGGVLAWLLGPLIFGPGLRELRRIDDHGWQPQTVILGLLMIHFSVIVGVLLTRGVALLLRALPDLRTRVEVLGEVLRVRSVSDDDETTWYVAFDDGRSAQIRVWKVSAAIAAAAREGTEMRAMIAPRLGHVYAIAPVEAPVGELRG